MRGIALTEKIRMALKGIGGVLSKPLYIAYATAAAFLFALLIYLIINWGIYGTLLMSPLGIVDKFTTIGLMATQLGKDVLLTNNGALLAVVSILQGMSIALIIYTLRMNIQHSTSAASRKSSTKALGGSGIAAAAAALGLGCIPCGTSIVLPIMTLFFSGSAYAAANIASIIVLVAALLVTLYSLYRLGCVAFAYTEQEKLKAEDI